MVKNGLTKPFGFILIITAHIIFYGSSHADVIGTVGQNISLLFTFNSTISKNSRIAVYKYIDKLQKISEYPKCKNKFDIYPENSSISFSLTNLSLNDNETYWATFFSLGKSTLLEHSNKVKLIVQEKSTSSTVPPEPSTSTKTVNSGTSSFFSSHAVTVIVVSPFLLLAAILPFLVICVAKPKEQIQEGPQTTSIPTAQEAVQVSVNTPESSLVYSVLDFPKRPPSAVEFSPRDTEYATISYLPEKKPRPHTKK